MGQLDRAVAGYDQVVLTLVALGAHPAVADGHGPAERAAHVRVVGHDQAGVPRSSLAARIRSTTVPAVS